MAHSVFGALFSTIECSYRNSMTLESLCLSQMLVWRSPVFFNPWI